MPCDILYETLKNVTTTRKVTKWKMICDHKPKKLAWILRMWIMLRGLQNTEAFHVETSTSTVRYTAQRLLSNEELNFITKLLEFGKHIGFKHYLRRLWQELDTFVETVPSHTHKGNKAQELPSIIWSNKECVNHEAHWQCNTDQYQTTFTMTLYCDPTTLLDYTIHTRGNLHMLRYSTWKQQSVTLY